ncbi:MAG: hypothetical protein DRH12_05760 [Deltaproteobacteria bacterium]|nr:MAG: hypothetical protein DRH12_05760 [Deltaproteobacteria bacterium]RLB75576.1 MAG: hypothetical protein DRH15_13860 [Deltaproteobacteria bacterium]
MAKIFSKVLTVNKISSIYTKDNIISTILRRRHILVIGVEKAVVETKCFSRGDGNWFAGSKGQRRRY